MARLIRSGEGVVAIIIAGFESLSRPLPGLCGCFAPSRPLRWLLPKRRVVGLPNSYSWLSRAAARDVWGFAVWIFGVWVFGVWGILG